jgi:hypothetical protein
VEPEDASPYPIVLRAWGGSPRRAAWGSTAVVVLSSALLLGLDVVADEDCRRCDGGAISGGIGMLVALGLVWRTLRRGRAGLELRIDQDGFVVHGERVPWGAVLSITWRSGPTEDFSPDFIEVRVRNTEGYQAPRDRTIYLEHGLYEIRANLLIDLLEAAALPRRVLVLAVEPPPPTR